MSSHPATARLPNGLCISCRRRRVAQDHLKINDLAPKAINCMRVFGGTPEYSRLKLLVLSATIEALTKRRNSSQASKCMNPILYIVTGAPGSGKTTALAALLQRPNPYLAFDIDWLTITASHLARTDIIFDRTTWPAYNALWLEILHAVYRNGKVAIFFSPFDTNDVEQTGQAIWYQHIEWLLLDCDDVTRQMRLSARSEWSDEMITEALSDAHALRKHILERLDTGTHTPDEVAEAILRWVERTQ
jgi:hypothetical protein